MSQRDTIRAVLTCWRNSGWQDRAGAAVSAAAEIEAGRTAEQAAAQLPGEFLASNGATKRDVARALEKITEHRPLTGRPVRRVLILTALDVEYAAVRSHVNVRDTARTSSGGYYEVGSVEGESFEWSAYIAEVQAGNVGAATEVALAVGSFKPDLVVFCGVAGAMKPDIELGTVIVPTKVYLYQGGKEANVAGTDGGTRFYARPESYNTMFGLVQLATAVRRSFDRPVEIKPIAAGEVLVGGSKSRTAELIREHYNDAIAVDMESGGVYLAAFRLRVPVIAVRGISDHMDDKTAESDVDRQPAASACAADFLVALLQAATNADLGQSPEEQ